MKKLIIAAAFLFSTLALSAQKLTYQATVFTYGKVSQTTDDVVWDDPQDVNTKIVINGQYIKIYNKAETIIRQVGEYTSKVDDDYDIITFYATDENEKKCKVSVGYVKKDNSYVLLVRYSDIIYSFYMKLVSKE